MIKPIHDPVRGKMRVAGLMSGSGASLLRIIEQQIALKAINVDAYEVVGIFSDNPHSKAASIGDAYEIPVFIRDIRKFYAIRNAKITDMRVRKEFDREILEVLKPLHPDVLAYAGYVWATTPPLVEAILGVNVHPADLTIEKGGRRAYAGANGVRDALLGGEKELRCSAHLVTKKIDGGPILMLSEPVQVNPHTTAGLEEMSRFYLRLLNQQARKLFARVMKDLALGRFQRDSSGLLYYDGSPIPNGVRLDEESEV